ncbi:MAG: methyltransferase domain-containing protein [bacterium]|nr:methyltransferase domain-containing protein [bacterium]
MTDRPTHPHDERRQQVHREWEECADAWRKWAPHFSASTWPVTHALIGMLDLSPGAAVLDIGCGVGDPSLPIAAQLADGGSVVGIDPAPSMVAACKARAEVLGIDNAEFLVASGENLEGYEAHFDAVVARWSVLFFDNVGTGLAHLRTRLRVGGRIAVSAWAPRRHNPMFAIPARELAEVMEIPRPDRNAPNPLRLSEDGELVAALAEAGFTDIHERQVRLLQFARDPEDYWAFLTGVSMAFRRAFSGLSPADQERVKRGVLRALEPYRSDVGVELPAVARVAAGTRSG